MNLIFFGDSLTWGKYGGSYFDALVPLLLQHTLINAGVGGDTVLNLLERLENDVLAHQPDGVFIMIGGNDAISYSQPATRQYYRNAKHIPDGVVTPDQFALAYRDLLTRLHAAHILAWVGLPPIEQNPTVVNALRHYNALAEEIARTLNIPVLDLMAAFTPAAIPERPPLGMDTILTIGKRESTGWNDYETARNEGGYTFTFDGLHLMPSAAEQAARLIAAFIEG